MSISATSPVGLPASPATKPSLNQQTATERRSLATAVRVVNASHALGQQNELVFALDPTSHHIVAKIVDRDTQQVIEQVPAEYILKLAEELTGKSPGTVR
jgi:uncharacterized FlaG/YvyC family protein